MNTLAQRHQTLQELKAKVRDKQDMYYHISLGVRLLCGICMESYSNIGGLDVYTHLSGIHAASHQHAAEQYLWLDPDHCPYCGGDIDKRGDGDSYEIQCVRCEYLFDED